MPDFFEEACIRQTLDPLPQSRLREMEYATCYPGVEVRLLQDGGFQVTIPSEVAEACCIPAEELARKIQAMVFEGSWRPGREQSCEATVIWIEECNNQMVNVLYLVDGRGPELRCVIPQLTIQDMTLKKLELWVAERHAERERRTSPEAYMREEMQVKRALEMQALFDMRNMTVVPPIIPIHNGVTADRPHGDDIADSVALAMQNLEITP